MTSRFISTAIIIIAAALGGTPVWAAEYTVTESMSGCNHMVIQGEQGYRTLKIQDGVTPAKKTKLQGFLDTFGISHLANNDTREITWVYIEAGWVSKADAVKKYRALCPQSAPLKINLL